MNGKEVYYTWSIGFTNAESMEHQNAISSKSDWSGGTAFNWTEWGDAIQVAYGLRSKQDYLTESFAFSKGEKVKNTIQLDDFSCDYSAQ